VRMAAVCGCGAHVPCYRGAARSRSSLLCALRESSKDR
jgi:hypothetical protein